MTEDTLENYSIVDSSFKLLKRFATGAKQEMCIRDRKVIIRTLDIGADKQVDYFNLGNEDNPAMGYLSLIHISLRTTQNTVVRSAPVGSERKQFT